MPYPRNPLESQIIPVKEESKYFPYTGTFKWQRNSFYGAGIDNYTKPPAQDQDMFMQLTNVQPTMTSVLERRWGYASWGTAVSTSTHPIDIYQNEVSNFRRIVVPGQSGTPVKAFTEGGTFVTNIYTPTNVALPTYAVRSVNSRSYQYFTDGFLADQKKWDGGTTVTQWGIDPGNTGNSGSVNQAPTVGADLAVAGQTAWTVLQGPPVNGTVNVTTDFGGSDDFIFKGFGFAIPAGSTIEGVQVEIIMTPDKTVNVVGGVNLVRAGSLDTAAAKVFNIPAGGTAVPFDLGGSTDLWGDIWTPSDINNVGFGFSFYIRTQAPAGSGIKCTVVSASMTVSYANAFLLSTGGAGNITLTKGRTYFLVYQNSTTGHIGDLSAPSVSTGPLTNNAVSITAIPVATDPQVDSKLILATADGNDETTLYLVANIPNAQTSYTDNTPDTTLVLQNIYQNNDANGIPHGVAGNKRPPTNAILPTKYKGRLYLLGTTPTVLWFSKSLGDLTTASGTICGRYEESWPGNFQMDIGDTSEQPSAVFTDGNVLYIGTQRRVYRIQGDGPENYQKPEVIFSEAGVADQEVLQIVYREGTPIGMIWLTPDSRVLFSDFNTYKDIGTPIQTTLNTITTGLQPVSAFASTSAFDLYMLAVPVSGSTNNTLCIFNTRTDQWYIWQPADAIIDIIFNIDTTGQPFILFLATSGTIYRISPTSTTDRGVTIVTTVQTSWLHLGDPELRKVLNELEVITSDTSGMTVTVEGANTDAQFATPDTVVSSASLAKDPFGVWKIFLAGKVSKHRYYRFTFVSSGTLTNVLEGITVEAAPFHRV